MCLFTPGWKNDNKEKAMKWIAKTRGNCPALAVAVLQSPDREIRTAALNRITDQRLLKHLAETESHYTPQLKDDAIRRITDQAFLVKLAKERNAAAVETLTDESILCEIAINDEFFYGKRNPYYHSIEEPNGNISYLAQIAFERLTTPFYIEKAARETNCDTVAYAYVSSAKDETELIAIAKNVQFNKFCRVCAVARIMDQALLKEFAESDPDVSVRTKAVRKLEDQELLAKIAENADETAAVRETAIRRITDPALRRKYCKSGYHEWHFDHRETNVNGDYLNVDEYYKCKWCDEVHIKDASRLL